MRKAKIIYRSGWGFPWVLTWRDHGEGVRQAAADEVAELMTFFRTRNPGTKVRLLKYPDMRGIGRI